MSTKFFRKTLISLTFFSGLLFLSVGSVRGNAARVPAFSVIEDSIPRLGRIAKTPDQLLKNALIRLKNRDTLGIILMGPNPEQLINLYKKMPEGKKANEIELNFVREFFYVDNGKLLSRALGKYGGKNFELVSWKSKGTTTIVEGDGKVFKDLEIMVKNKSTEVVERIFFINSIYVDSEGCKIWGFQDHKADSKANFKADSKGNR